MNGFHHLVDSFQWLIDQTGQPEVSLAARLALAALFAVGGVYKLRNPRTAAMAGVNFRVISRPHAAFGYAIGAAELLTALLLLAWLPSISLAGCVIAGIFALVFAAVTARALVVGEHFPCHCLSSADNELSITTLLRAVLMTLAAAIGAVDIAGSDGQVYPSFGSALEGAAVATVALGIPTAVLLGIRVWQQYRRYVESVDWEWVLIAYRSSTQRIAESEGD